MDGDTSRDKPQELGEKPQAAERQDADRRDEGPTGRREAEDEETEGSGTVKGDSGSTGGGGGGDGGPEEDAGAKRKEEEAAALSSHLQVIAMHMVRRWVWRFAVLGACGW